MVRDNSLIAYRAEIKKFNKRENLIYGFLLRAGRAMTDREIKDELFGFTADMNTTRPRLSDLIRAGWIRETGKTIDGITGKRVRKVKAVSPEERAGYTGEPIQQDLFA
jgi:hypothetical protein